MHTIINVSCHLALLVIIIIISWPLTQIWIYMCVEYHVTRTQSPFVKGVSCGKNWSFFLKEYHVRGSEGFSLEEFHVTRTQVFFKGVSCEKNWSFFFNLVARTQAFSSKVAKKKHVKNLPTILFSDSIRPSSVLEQWRHANNVHWENYISISFPIEWDMIVVTVFLSILNYMEFHLVPNR